MNENKDEDSLIAVGGKAENPFEKAHLNQGMAQTNAKNKRRIKIGKKLISRACLDVSLMKDKHSRVH